MKIKTAYISLITASVVFAGIAGVHAQMPRQDMEVEEEMTDEVIAKRKRNLDEMLNKVITMLETKFKDSYKLQLKVKNDRIAFEKQRVAERKAFLDSLRNINTEQRKSALAKFNMEQAEKQRNFIEKQNQMRKEFLNRAELERGDTIKGQRSQQRKQGPPMQRMMRRRGQNGQGQGPGAGPDRDGDEDGRE